MIPTEQDNKLREKLYSLLKTDPRADTYVIPYRVMDIFVDFITADRKRVELEARIDELEHTFVSYDNALASELVENPEWEYGQVSERIAELKAQQEVSK